MVNFKTVVLSNTRILFAAILLSLSASSYGYEVEVNISSDSVAFSTVNSEVKSFIVQIHGPDGDKLFSESSDSSTVIWNLPGDVDDGRYKYEVQLSNVVAGSRSRTDPVDSEIESQVVVSTTSGSVLVQSGSIVLPDEELGQRFNLKNTVGSIATALLNTFFQNAHADIVQRDDVISTFSMCLGNDCVNGETFDFDTLRMKENNIRMHFDDTSVSASFPSNDWRININDTNNGGASYFGIEDATSGRQIMTLEAGAPLNALFIDSTGHLGLGTSTPVTTIEAVAGNTPTLRLNQNSTEGFGAQSWDLGGNESGLFIRDVNSATTPFRLIAGAPSNAIVVNTAGNVGLGIDNPTEKLHVDGNAIISGNLELGSSRGIKHQIRRLDLDKAMVAFTALEPVMFKYNHSPQEQAIGFIAEDVPDLVATQNKKSLKPMDIIAVLTKVVQEQQKTIEALSGKIDGLLADQAVLKNAN